MVLIGESDARNGKKLESLYLKYNTNCPKIARACPSRAPSLTKSPSIAMSPQRSASPTALRMIAEQYADTDIHTILDAIGADSRIGQ